MRGGYRDMRRDGGEKVEGRNFGRVVVGGGRREGREELWERSLKKKTMRGR